MNVSAISSHTSASAAAAINYGEPAGIARTAKSSGTAPSAGDIKKAASQFESIILRQLLSPAIEPLMSGGIGGASGSGGGGGIYGYMLTDVLADNLSKGGGLGLARMLEKQLSPPKAVSTDGDGLTTSILSTRIK